MLNPRTPILVAAIAAMSLAISAGKSPTRMIKATNKMKAPIRFKKLTLNHEN
jgi:hypothetical protein